MIEQIISDKPQFKLRLTVVNCNEPKDMKHLKFTGEQYNSEGKITDSSTYDFFLDKKEVIKLWTTLANQVI